jgi:hypothetical protein
VEVDLQTLQVVDDRPYERTISALSSAQPTIPLTVGTLDGIHIHDHRAAPEAQRDRQERVDTYSLIGKRSVVAQDNTGPLSQFSPLAQSGPLSILHTERPGTQALVSDDIFVAGRFRSILHYDRRMFPALKGSIHSGGSLCCMTSLPYPFSCVDSELRRQGELSLEQVQKSKSKPGEQTLIACGEYNTKGSLELYGYSTPTSSQANGHLLYKSTMKNRQTASGSKLLSVINHGTRILFSDVQGNLKWVERDGFTEVRRHQISDTGESEDQSQFNTMPMWDEIARKLVSTNPSEAEHGKANDDDVLFWTGERLGLVSFTSKAGFNAKDFRGEANARTAEEMALEKQQEEYSQGMRRALERQANDVRFVQYLGAGIRHGM